MLIGSRAMRHHFKDSRQPKDYDAFARVPVEGVETFWHDSFPEAWDRKDFATKDELYTIKVSHSFWDLHGTWTKHMNDIIFLHSRGAKFLPEVFDILHPVWLEKHGAKRVNLNMSKDEFFADAVNRKYDHDSIHRSTAYYDRPLYESILKDGSEVLTDRAKFDRLSYQDQIRLVEEEVYATALERWIIPSEYTFSPRAAYARGLKKTITSLTKGWFSLWIVLHYQDLHIPGMDYVAMHRSKSDQLILL